nr:hypothetical protein [uncultured Dorea sp.]
MCTEEVKNIISCYKKGVDKEKNMLILIRKFQPVINKYARKLFSLEYEDALQELIIAFMNGINGISEYENEGQCVSYLVRSIQLRFYELQRKCILENEIKRSSLESIVERDSGIEEAEYGSIELKLDFDRIKSSKNEVWNEIIDGIIEGLNDSEIAKNLHISRQYVNRCRRKIIKIYK